MRRLYLILLFWGVPAFVHAQAPTAIRVVISGGASPVTNDIPITSWTCGQAPASPQPINPTGFQYVDPQDATKVCKYKDPGTGPLLSLPFGGTAYTATAAYVNSVNVGPTSNVTVSFTKPGVAPSTAPAGFQVVP